jgi:archaellum component FlaF (FlaF/FlaG flagellin family)
MGRWPRGRELADEHLAVAFYNGGQLIKKYSTLDLVKDGSAIKRTTSHYFWLAGTPQLELAPEFGSEDIFTLITLDNIQYTFDITTGEIISQMAMDLRDQSE